MSVTVPTADPIQLGAAVELTADLTSILGEDVEASAIQWLVRDPTGVENDMSSQVNNPSTGVYQLVVTGDTVGDWYWRIVTSGQVAVATGYFTVVDDYSIVPTPSDPTDLRVLVPRARRYCEGPYGPPQGKSPLQDDQLYAMVADGCSDIILFTGSLFEHKLIVTSRDGRVGFPTGWATDCTLEEWECALVTTQVALNYFVFLFRDMPVSQSIKNEGTEWTYSLSANVIRNYLDSLKAARDMAIQGLREHHPVMDRYASNIRIRDQQTVAILEWWDTVSPGLSGGAAYPGGQEAAVIPWTPGWTGAGFTP